MENQCFNRLKKIVWSSKDDIKILGNEIKTKIAFYKSKIYICANLKIWMKSTFILLPIIMHSKS
jgi:hypothetical protein